MASDLWQDLEQMSMQFLQNAAIQSMRNQASMKELQLQLAHDKNIRQLDTTTNILYKKYDQIDSLNSEITELANQSEGTKLAFDLISDKMSSNSDPSSLLTSVHDGDLERLNNELNLASKDVVNLRGAKQSLNDAISDISLIKRDIEEQLITRGPGPDKYFSPEDVRTTTSSPLYTDALDELDLLDDDSYGVSGQPMKLDNMLNAIQAENLNQDIINYFDLNQDTILDHKDMAMLTNIQDIEGTKAMLASKYGAKAEGLFKNVEDYFKSGEELARLNTALYTRFKMDPNQSGIDATQLSHISAMRDEKMQSANNKFNDIISTMLTEDPDQEGVYDWNETFESTYDALVSQQVRDDMPNEFYEKSETNREQNKQVLFNMLGILAQAGNYEDFLDRLETFRKTPGYEKTVRMLESQFPIFASGLFELKKRDQEVDQWSEYYFQQADFGLKYTPNTKPVNETDQWGDLTPINANMYDIK